MDELHRVICDLGRTNVRFALAEGEGLDVRYIHHSWEATEAAAKRGATLESLARDYLAERNLDPASTTLYVSVPTYVVGSRVNIPTMPYWAFDQVRLQKNLGLRHVRAVHDMTALGYSAHVVVGRGQYTVIAGGQVRHGYPLVVIGVRTGLGAMGFVLDYRDGENAQWLPVSTEAGHLGLNPTSEDQHEILHILRTHYGTPERPQWTITAEDVLSGRGSVRLLRAARQLLDYEKPELKSTHFTDMLEELEGFGARGAHIAQFTKTIWCEFLGNFARNLALAYGAWSGVLLAGPLPSVFLGEGEEKLHAAFLRGFTVRGPDENYLTAIPVALLNEPHPYLIGLARFRRAPNER